MTKAAPDKQRNLLSTLLSRLRRACTTADLRRVLVALYLLLATEIWLLGCFAGRLNGDSTSYLALADSLVAGRGMVEPGPDGEFFPNLIRPPGYPAFLACLQLLFGRTLEAPVLAQAVLICLSIEMVRRRLAASVGPGFSLALPALAMCCPGFLVHAGRISSEAPATFLLTVGLELFQRQRTGSIWLFGVGVSLAAGCLFRQNLLIVIPLLYGILWVRGSRERGTAWILLAGAALVLGPWAIRNYRLTGVASPVSALPEQYRYTYHADVLLLDARLREWWRSGDTPASSIREADVSPVAEASTLLNQAHRRAIERSGLATLPGNADPSRAADAGGQPAPSPNPVATISTGVFPWGSQKAKSFLLALNEETRRLVEKIGVPRALAGRILFGIPRTWFTGPEMYPPGPVRWFGVLLAALQLGILAALWGGAGQALRTTTQLVSVLMLALVCGDILRYPAGTFLTVPILGFLAARAGTASSVWTAVSLQLLVVLSARHAEFRYMTTHYPVILALAIEAASRRYRKESRSVDSSERLPTSEQLKCANR